MHHDLLPTDATEHMHQVRLFKWLTDLSERQEIDPIVRMALYETFAVPNAGKRGPKARAEMVNEGLKAGVPDICTPFARGGFSALYVEMKRRKPRGTLSKLQKERIASLRALGNRVEITWGWVEAAMVYVDYFEGDIPEKFWPLEGRNGGEK